MSNVAISVHILHNHFGGVGPGYDYLDHAGEGGGSRIRQKLIG